MFYRALPSSRPRPRLGGVKPGGGGHGRVRPSHSVPGMAAIPGGGGHGGPPQHRGSAAVEQRRAPGRNFSTEELELHCICPITQARRCAVATSDKSIHEPALDEIISPCLYKVCI